MVGAANIDSGPAARANLTATNGNAALAALRDQPAAALLLDIGLPDMTGFDVLDLDTPLLLATDPIQGGYRYDGPMLQPWTTEGLGLAVETPSHGQITTEA